MNIMIMTTINFNPKLMIQEEVLPLLGFTKTTELKGVSMEYALANSNEVVRQVLSKMPLQNKHKYITVFVKPMQTKIGSPTCIPGWHIDAVSTPLKARTNHHEIHHIWCGYSNDTTEFIDTPLLIDITDDDTLQTMKNKIEKYKYNILKIPKNTIVTYSRLNLHRAAICKESSDRLLIRVSETDTLFGGIKRG